METKFKLKMRPANRADTGIVYQLIRELAIYEKMLDEVVATEGDLEASLFDDPKGPEVLIAEERSDVVGFVLFFHNFSTFVGRKGLYIEDLYVREAYRGKGYGKALLEEVCRIAKERNCGRLEWSVLDWNQPAIDFYKRMGAVPMNGWSVFRLTEEAIENVVKGHKK